MKIAVDLNSKDTTHNREIMLEVVKKDETFFDYASEELKNNYSFNLEAVRVNPKVYYYINSDFKNDRDIVLLAANPKKNKFGIGIYIRDELAYYNIDEKLRDDEEVMLKAIQVSSFNFEYASDRLKNNKEFCYKATEFGVSIKKSGLLEDDDLVFKAAKKGDIPDETYPKRYLENKDYIKLIVSGTKNKIGGGGTMDALWYLQKIKSKYLNDAEVAKIALQSTSQAFQVINKKFRKDENMVLTSLKSEWNPHLTLDYADKKFKNDREFVEKAISLEGESLIYSNKKFLNDRKLVFKALNNNLYTVDKRFKKYSNDKEFINQAIYKHKLYGFFQYINKKYKKDKELTKKIVKDHFSYFKHIEKKFKNDEDIIFIFLINHFYILQENITFDAKERPLSKKDIECINKKLLNEKFIIKVLKNLSDNNHWDWVWYFTDSNYKSLVWKHFNKKLKKKKSFIFEVCKINIHYKDMFDMNDFYKNKKYDKEIYDLFMNNQPTIRMRKDGEIIVKDKDLLKFEIDVNNKIIHDVDTKKPN